MSSSNVPEQDHKKTGLRSTILGYTYAVLVLVTSIIAVISAQLSVSTTPVFQRSTMRYVWQTAITLSTVILCRNTVQIQTRHIYMVIIIAVFDFVYNYGYYLAAAYLPVGNMDGIFTALIIAVLGFYDIFRKKCKLDQIIAGILCSVGLLLLLQPWEIKGKLMEKRNTDRAPCEYFGAILEDSEDNIANNTFPSTTSGIAHKNTDDYLTMLQTTAITVEGNRSVSNISADSETDASDVDRFNDTWKGYVLVTSAAISLAVVSIFMGKMTSELDYQPAAVSFWVALLNAVISATLMLIVENPSLPNAKYCVLFTFVLAIVSGVNAFFVHIMLTYLLPSKCVLFLSTSMVALFISQNISLPGVQPGRGNAAEFIGAVVTFIGAISSPVYQLCLKPHFQRGETYHVNEAIEIEDHNGTEDIDS